MVLVKATPESPHHWLYFLPPPSEIIPVSLTYCGKPSFLAFDHFCGLPLSLLPALHYLCGFPKRQAPPVGTSQEGESERMNLWLPDTLSGWFLLTFEKGLNK